eukprot:Amastigsp_a895_54.p4 type:complete len:136 gc:universal Amastigsp_a895_54:506-913(+)
MVSLTVTGASRAQTSAPSGCARSLRAIRALQLTLRRRSRAPWPPSRRTGWPRAQRPSAATGQRSPSSTSAERPCTSRTWATLRSCSRAETRPSSSLRCTTQQRTRARSPASLLAAAPCSPTGASGTRSSQARCSA